MHRITVRRRAGEAGDPFDLVIQGKEARNLYGDLQRALRTAAAERGKAPWADSDPEVWVEGLFVGTLRPGGDAADLARQTVVQLMAGTVGARARGRRL